jgi:hypothetical protein
MTMLCVTHEMGFARTVANRVIFMDKGEIVEQAAPDEFFDNPQPTAPSCSSARSCTESRAPAPSPGRRAFVGDFRGATLIPGFAIPRRFGVSCPFAPPRPLHPAYRRPPTG